MGRPAPRPSSDRDLKDRAHALVLKGKLDQAIELYRGLLVANARDATIRLRHAELCRKAGKVDEAVASYLATAQLLEREGHSSRARAVLTCALQLAPGEPSLLGPLRRLNDELRQTPSRFRTAPPLSLVPPPVASSPGREQVSPAPRDERVPAARSERVPAQQERSTAAAAPKHAQSTAAPAPKKARSSTSPARHERAPAPAAVPQHERVLAAVDFDALPPAPPRDARRAPPPVDFDFDALPPAPPPRRAAPPVAQAPRNERVFEAVDFDALPPAPPPRRAAPAPPPPPRRAPPHATTTPQRPKLRLAWSLSDEDFTEAPTDPFCPAWAEAPRYPAPQRRQQRRAAARRR